MFEEVLLQVAFAQFTRLDMDVLGVDCQYACQMSTAVDRLIAWAYLHASGIVLLWFESIGSVAGSL